MMLIKIDIFLFLLLVCSVLYSRCPRDRINDKPHCLIQYTSYFFFYVSHSLSLYVYMCIYTYIFAIRYIICIYIRKCLPDHSHFQFVLFICIFSFVLEHLTGRLIDVIFLVSTMFWAVHQMQMQNLTFSHFIPTWFAIIENVMFIVSQQKRNEKKNKIYNTTNKRHIEPCRWRMWDMHICACIFDFDIPMLHSICPIQGDSNQNNNMTMYANALFFSLLFKEHN